MEEMKAGVCGALVLATALTGMGWLSPATVEAQHYGTPYYGRAPVRSAAEIEQARKVVEEYLEKTAVPGLQVSVGVGGRIIWSGGFGLADVEQGVPVTRLTRLISGSIGKSHTAAGLARLYEQGKLDWDADVRTYVPFFPKKPWPITTRQLVGHVSGIRHYKPEGVDREFFIREEYTSIRDGLKIWQDDPLLFEPGTKYSYSSYAYNLAGVVIEEITGQDYISYMTQNVFEPLGMRDTEAYRWYDIMPGRARLYERPSMGTPGNYKVGFAGAAHKNHDKLINAPFADPSYKVAAGAWLTTCDDLVRFASGLLQPGFLKAETLSMIFTSMKTKAGEETGYGMGWRIGKDSSGRRTYSHGGGALGHTASLLVYPDEKIVVAVMVNITSASLDQVTQSIAQAFLLGVAQD